jgi:small subunit ribosomal protein S6
MQQKYEVIYILDPGTSAEDSQVVAAKIEQIVADAKGTVGKKEEWGKRRLAYLVQKQREGIYWFFQILVDAATIDEVTRNLRLFEKVIKFMVVKDDFSNRKSKSKKPKSVSAHPTSHVSPHGSAPRPAVKPVEKPVEKLAEKPVEKPVESPTENPA